MRTGQKLSRISTLADLLRQDRGDTLWDDDDRERVSMALDLLEGVSAWTR